MTREDYCSFELSKLLKEKGFDWDCRCYYFSENNERYYSNEVPRNNHKLDADLACPTHQMAMKWLREEHDIIIVIEPHSYNHMEEKTSSYDFYIWYGDNYEYPLTTNYPTYEEAVEAALKFVLENLI